MLRIFIYHEDQDKWVEERSHLLHHDLAAFIDEDEKIIYLWNGLESTKDKLKKGRKALLHLLKVYTENSYQINTIKKKIPPHLKLYLEHLFADTKKEQKAKDYRYSHFSTIRIHFLLSLITLVLPLVALFILNSSLFWEASEYSYIISSEAYNGWWLSIFIIIMISLLLFIPQLAMSVYERDQPIMFFSITSIIICVSFLVYLQQGIFLFQFQPLSTPNLFYIAKSDIYWFVLLTISAIMLIEIPNFIKTINFLITYKQFIF
ncbi:MAG: hypothetical protein EU548_02870 [Promethearchaeota archaeon]|nr:MAG: hypothetical protein EU548_02870 [Candidatus Lokiarchaeota archaeon]